MNATTSMPPDHNTKVKKVSHKRTNQHKPLPPEEDLEPIIRYYWQLGFNDKAVAELCLDHFDRSQFGLSDSSVKRLRGKWELHGTRKQKHSFETIAPSVHEIRSRFPTMGARTMVQTLSQSYGLRVPEKLVADYLKLIEPGAVEARKRYKWKRKIFYCSGVNDMIVLDQHDKWKRFGIFLHAGLDPFSGRLRWLKVWWTNRNPRLIVSYYIEAGRRDGGIPLITQSDLGKENNGVANCHTCLRHELDPSLSETLQHKWKYSTHNIKSEAFWSVLRRQFSPGFEAILDYGIAEGYFDINEVADKLLLRWLAIPWLQAELDAWAQRFNNTPRRADKRKILPHGIPNLINAKPHLYGTRDFKVIVPPDMFDRAEQQWAPPDDPVFQLVPPSFQEQIQPLYAQLGSPVISSATFWDVYLALQHALQEVPEHAELQPQLTIENNCFEVDIPVLEGLRNLRNGDPVINKDINDDSDEEAEVENSLRTTLDAEDLGIDLREFVEFSDVDSD